MLWVVLGTVGIVLAMIGVGLLVDRKWALLPRADDLEGGVATAPPRPPPPPPGETAATRVRGDAHARAKLVAGQRCCGGAMAETDEEALVYGGRAITVVRLRCATCAKRRSVYVEPS